jgi:catechol 2,3-dioxygenase-like lactoylglutathione lyase family enzyme
MLKQITSALYWVSDIAISVDFYQKVGFELKENTEQHAVLTLGNFAVELVPAQGHEQDEFSKDASAEGKGKGVYLQIEVEDIDGLHSELVGKGLQPSAEPRDWPWGNREFVIKDPDGYKLCFWQLSKD